MYLSENKPKHRYGFKKLGKYSSITIGIICLVLMITNPSLKNFKEFLPSDELETVREKTIKTSVSKTSNYFIFSIFTEEQYLIEKHEDSQYYLSRKYIGIFNNFYKI